MNNYFNVNNIRILYSKEQDKMCDNGWHIVIPQFREETEEFYERLSRKYRRVKIYYATTSVRGYYSVFAMVKN